MQIFFFPSLKMCVRVESVFLILHSPYSSTSNELGQLPNSDSTIPHDIINLFTGSGPSDNGRLSNIPLPLSQG